MYTSKEQAQNRIAELGAESAYSAVYIGQHYAKAHGVETAGWYIFNNINKRLVG